jgi:2-iminobutanoate/2-iminopropanoate deaminase
MMRSAAAALLLLTACAAADAQPRPEVEHFRRPGSSAPFSPAVRVGDTLYLSGMIGARPDGTLPEGIEAQARQTMDNVRTSLALAGRSLDNVVKCTVMLENMADWAAFNRVYVTYFRPERLPARSAFGADGLALGALVEVECIAHAAAGERR